MLDSTPQPENQPQESYREPTHNSKRFITQPELGLILRLHTDGLSQVAIAKRLDKSQPAISKALARLGVDSTLLAQHHLKAKAYTASRKVTALVEKGKDDVALKAAKVVLEGAGVITQGVTAVVGVQVMIGTQNQPALQADTVEVEVLDGTMGTLSPGS